MANASTYNTRKPPAICPIIVGDLFCFANTIGGVIVLGIKGHRNRYDEDRFEVNTPRSLNTLRMIGFGDNIVSGYPTILRAWKDEHWRKPTLLDRTELRQVDLTMPLTSLLPESVLVEMKAHFGEEAYHAMTSEEQMILAYVWNGDCISNTELQ